MNFSSLVDLIKGPTHHTPVYTGTGVFSCGWLGRCGRVQTVWLTPPSLSCWLTLVTSCNSQPSSLVSRAFKSRLICTYLILHGSKNTPLRGKYHTSYSTTLIDKCSYFADQHIPIRQSKNSWYMMYCHEHPAMWGSSQTWIPTTLQWVRISLSVI